MNKIELIDIIAEKAELTKAVASRAFDALLDGMTKALQKGDPVVIFKFGSFTTNSRPGRKGRNPSTGEEINIKPTKVVRFKAGKALKEAVKKEHAEA